MLIPVTLTFTCGRHPGIVAVVSALTVSTTRKVRIASGVSQASTATSADPSLLQMLAKVSERMVASKKGKTCTKEMNLSILRLLAQERVVVKFQTINSHTSVNFFIDKGQEFSTC